MIGDSPFPYPAAPAGSAPHAGRGADLLPSPERRGAGGEAFSRGPGMTARARSLRNGMTAAERVLWSGLRGDQTGVRFRRQLVIDQRYIVDFCAPEIRLVVEADGGQHVGSDGDLVRTEDLQLRGYAVMRFWNNDILANRDGVLETITWRVRDLLAAKRPLPRPLSETERGESDRLATEAPPERAQTRNLRQD